MKKILLCVSLLSMFAAGFVGCSQKREWNHDQRKAMREALRRNIARMVDELRECQERTFVWCDSLGRYWEARDFASEEELGKMAMEDYRQKTGTIPAKAETAANADGTLSIALYDADGKLLDTYAIDPVTGTGTDSAGGEVSLPQTGYSGIYKVIAGLAVLMTLGGSAIMIRTRKKQK